MFKRVLIANRGEIAIRIARAAAALGMESVAVFTPADALSLHTRLADRGAARSAPAATRCAAYLDIDAHRRRGHGDSGCDCVHPGYGFLSENAAFAAALRRPRASRFIGPLAGDAGAVRRQGRRPARWPSRSASPSSPAAPAALASAAEADRRRPSRSATR